MKKPWKLAYRRKHPEGCCCGLLKVLERRQSEIICITREGWVWLITQVEPMKGPADGWEMSLCWSQCSSVSLGTVTFIYPTAALYGVQWPSSFQQWHCTGYSDLHLSNSSIVHAQVWDPISFKLHPNVSGVPTGMASCLQMSISKCFPKLGKWNCGILQCSALLCPYLCKQKHQWLLWETLLPVNTGHWGTEGSRSWLFCTTGSFLNFVTVEPHRVYLIKELRSLTSRQFFANHTQFL